MNKIKFSTKTYNFQTKKTKIKFEKNLKALLPKKMMNKKYWVKKRRSMHPAPTFKFGPFIFLFFVNNKTDSFFTKLVINSTL